MVPRTTWLVAGAAGYVLGARVGRERYDQIVEQTRRLWSDPTVQQTVAQTQEAVEEQVPAVAEKAGRHPSAERRETTPAPPTAVVPEQRHG